MKPTSPHDPLDDLIAAALHGELTPEERTQFDARLRNEPATQVAYQKAQLMHDLLEKTHKNAQPDPDFERRMVSGVRRKLQTEQHRETSWESLLVLWTSVKRFLPRNRLTQYGIVLAFVSVVSLSMLISAGNHVQSVFTTIGSQLAYAGSAGGSDVAWNGQPKKDLRKVIENQGNNYVDTAQKGITLSGYVDTQYTEQFAGTAVHSKGTTLRLPDAARAKAPQLASDKPAEQEVMDELQQSQQKAASDSDSSAAPSVTTPSQGDTIIGGAIVPPATASVRPPTMVAMQSPDRTDNKASSWDGNWVDSNHGTDSPNNRHGYVTDKNVPAEAKQLVAQLKTTDGDEQKKEAQLRDLAKNDSGLPASPTPKPAAAPADASNVTIDTPAPVIDSRKLIRNAQLDLEVKSFQAAIDQITALTKAAGGYVDTSNSQKGGNGKLQGTVVVKVLPQNLDGFLFKLRDLGQLRNQSVSTDDVTKDYVDTMARLDNSRKMEVQLQDLLKRTNGKVSELLQVERELARVRGEIEQMQGQLKLYDFQVQYATVTMNMRETDLNETAAYLLKENDNFSLFATNVEDTFQQTRKAADDFKAHIISANLNHNSGSDVSATMVVSVPPDQIESFLSQLRSMGRVDNFTRQTQRVPKDGGDTDQPADQTLTDKDKVIVNITIRSDDESRKQVAMTVVTAAVDDALDQAKNTALSNSGEILTSSLNKTPQGQSNGQLSVRVPGKSYHALLDAYKTLGRTASFSLQRDDNSGPGVNGDDSPVIVTLSLTDEEAPLQQTEMSVLATDVDAQAQQLKKDAASAGVQVKASSFEREPNGMEMAQMTFRLPMSKYPVFLESLKKLGHVEVLTVNRVDRPDQTRTDDTAPAEISLRLHNQGDIVADDDGIMATLRKTFGDGAGALFGSVRVIGIMIAFIIPWALAIGLIAWVVRRIYIWKKK
jgi:hypothetical protein